MSRIEFEPWKPEESVGKPWHAFASLLDSDPVHDGTAVPLSSVGGRLAVFFRGLGGDATVEIKPVAAETSYHRLSFLRRLGTWADEAPRASFDGAALRLPESLATFPDARANAALYLWLATAAVALRDQTAPQIENPLHADLAAIETTRAMTARALENAPGYAKLHADLCAATLLFRHTPNLPAAEAAIEARICAALGEDIALPPPPLRALTRSEAMVVETRATEGTPEEGQQEGKTKRARRRNSDQATALTAISCTSSKRSCPLPNFSTSTAGLRMTTMTAPKRPLMTKTKSALGNCPRPPPPA